MSGNISWVVDALERYSPLVLRIHKNSVLEGIHIQSGSRMCFPGSWGDAVTGKPSQPVIFWTDNANVQVTVYKHTGLLRFEGEASSDLEKRGK